MFYGPYIFNGSKQNGLGASTMNKRVVLVHGGAGTWKKARLNNALKVLKKAAAEAFNALERDILLAVRRGINILEDSPLFNAGVGSALNLLGEVEVDASIMDDQRNCGAIASVKNVKYAIDLAYYVMRYTPHILLTGDSVKLLAKKFNLETEMRHLITNDRLNMWKKAINIIFSEMGERIESLDDELLNYIKRRYNKLIELLKNNPELLERIKSIRKEEIIGDTVGIVVYYDGKLAAGTSTGGTFLKLPGRIGDTPLIGAGTFASKELGAVSATGIGETIIRTNLSFFTALNIGNYGVSKGLKLTFTNAHPKPDAGVIAIDKEGNWGVAHTTEHMPVAVISENEEKVDFVWEKF